MNCHRAFAKVEVWLHWQCLRQARGRVPRDNLIERSWVFDTSDWEVGKKGEWQRELRGVREGLEKVENVDRVEVESDVVGLGFTEFVFRVWLVVEE